MNGEQGFSYRPTKDCRVRIDWNGRTVTVLKGGDAKRLLSRLNGAEPETIQLLLAKATGNFKRGNEKRVGP